jgi:hypothetical protein
VLESDLSGIVVAKLLPAGLSLEKSGHSLRLDSSSKDLILYSLPQLSAWPEMKADFSLVLS